MYLVEDFYKNNKERWKLEPLLGETGFKRKIESPHATTPGLALAGFLKNFCKNQILLLGKTEKSYLEELTADLRYKRLEALITSKTPLVLLTQKIQASDELLQICKRRKVALLSSSLNTIYLLNKITFLLNEEFSPTLCCHGSLVEVFDVGVLIQGEPSVGKSDSALGLIERGHKLISDDVVKVVKREEGYLQGLSLENSRHRMSVRGVGIINIANMYGAVCVKDKKSLDIVVRLEVWNAREGANMEVGDAKWLNILGIEVPFHVLYVNPGRDTVLLIETLALQYKLNLHKKISARE